VVLFLLGLTALTSLSQRWNTYVWLAVEVVVLMPLVEVVLVDYLLLLDTQ
jgi:hypothetical protein